MPPSKLCVRFPNCGPQSTIPHLKLQALPPHCLSSMLPWSGQNEWSHRVTHIEFLQQLRTTVPHFGEKEGTQQDAAEWASHKKSVEQYMMGQIQRTRVYLPALCPCNSGPGLRISLHFLRLNCDEIFSDCLSAVTNWIHLQLP